MIAFGSEKANAENAKPLLFEPLSHCWNARERQKNNLSYGWRKSWFVKSQKLTQFSLCAFNCSVVHFSIKHSAYTWLTAVHSPNHFLSHRTSELSRIESSSFLAWIKGTAFVFGFIYYKKAKIYCEKFWSTLKPDAWIFSIHTPSSHVLPNKVQFIISAEKFYVKKNFIKF